MHPTRRCSLLRSALAAGLLLVLLAPMGAAAQESTFSAALLGSVGGSLDAEPGDSLTNFGYQLNLSFLTEPRTHVTLRLGQLALDDEEPFGNLTGADLTYATLGGEFRYRETYYDSGLYLALGGYRLAGDSLFGGAADDETSLGVAVGATGDFELDDRFSILVEVSGHWVDFEDQQIFLMGSAGLAYHF